MLCDLQNKNSDFYLEMIKALKILNETSNKYVIWNSLSKKILRKADILINEQIRIELYQNEAVRYLNSKNKLIPMISIFFIQLINSITYNFVKYISTIIIFTNIWYIYLTCWHMK